jgi:hypothetical protein
MQRRDRGERLRRRDGENDTEKETERKRYWKESGKETELNRQRGETEEQR